MEIKIYTSKGAVRHTTDTTRKESTRSQQLMGDNIVQIVFNHTEELHFKAGDSITYKGEKFTLIQDYKAEVVNEYEYHYELKFEGAEGLFKTLPFFHYITDGERTEKEPAVNYTATLPLAAEMVVSSLRHVSGDETWQVGLLAEVEGSKYLNFSADSIFNAFRKVADEFKTEWWLDGKAVNFCRCEWGDLQTFSAKADGGLSGAEIASGNELVPNRIYAYGGDRNITRKYTGQGLAYNTRLRLPAGVEYVDVSGGAENTLSKTVFFDNDEVGNVYPRRVGIITNVETKGAAKAPIYYFSDEGIDFDPAEQWIDGTTMMVHFESGMLQGRDFEMNYDKKLKRFEIINTQEGEIQVPFGSIVPKAGDKYVLWNMEMPQSYITNAEQELQSVAQEYVDNLNRKTPEITCRAFEPYFDKYGKVVTIGSKIKLEDGRLKGGYVQSRVTRCSHPLFCESQVEFTLSENVASGRLTQIENKIEDVTADNAQNVQATRAVSRRAWRDAQELSTALEALQAELVLVGNPESQFSCSCVFKSNKDNDPNRLAVSAGELQHVVYNGEAGGKWTVEAAEFTLEEDVLHYIYFKCSKQTGKGLILVSTVRLGLESEPGCYLFLGGVVSSVFESARIVNIVSGFTQIAGGNITTERIQDPTGKLVIDLTANPPQITARGGAKFVGSFSFESADGLDNIAGVDAMKSGISTAQSSASDAQAAADKANKKLSDWASDNIISPVEKTALLQQMANIEAEYAQVKAQAERYKADTTDYMVAYNDAIAALLKYTAATPVEIPVVMAEYANIATYYGARKTIGNAISAKADLRFLKDAFSEESTDISGGLVLSGFIGVRNKVGSVLAGMAGKNFIANKEFSSTDETCPMIFSGNEGSVEDAQSAKTRIYPSGLLYTKNLQARGGIIGGFEIGENWLQANGPDYNASLSAAAIIMGKNSSEYNNSFGVYSYPNPSGGGRNHTEVAVAVNCKIGDTGNFRNTGINIAVEGKYDNTSVLSKNQTCGNFALYIEKGAIAGTRYAFRSVISTYSITTMDHHVAVEYGAPALDLRLPPNPEIGQTYWLTNDSTRTQTIVATGGLNINTPGGSPATTKPLGRTLVLLYFNGYQWRMGWLNT